MPDSQVLSAVFSNLSKAAEKQRLPDASALFSQLADHYRQDGDGGRDLGYLAEQFAGDIGAEYPELRKAAAEAAHRGVLRAVTWGEKVTKTQKALVDRYASKGEELLAGADLFICEACGFIFLGTEPPEICPVCKAPALRFSLVK